MPEAGRDKTGYRGGTPAALDQALHTTTPHLGLWLDTSTLSVEQTVDAIIARLARATIPRQHGRDKPLTVLVAPSLHWLPDSPIANNGLSEFRSPMQEREWVRM